MLYVLRVLSKYCELLSSTLLPVVSICKLNLKKRKHRQRIYVTCLIWCCSSVTGSVITGRSVSPSQWVIMSCHLTWLKEELPKCLSFYYSCCKIWRKHRRISLRMVTLRHVHLWHWPQQMPREEYTNRASTYCPHTVPSTSHHLQLRALPLQAVTVLPRKDKAEVVSTTHLVLWLTPHFFYIRSTRSCLSHPCKGRPGFGPSLFSTQKPPWLQETSPEGFKVLCNYWIL